MLHASGEPNRFSSILDPLIVFVAVSALVMHYSVRLFNWQLQCRRSKARVHAAIRKLDVAIYNFRRRPSVENDELCQTAMSTAQRELDVFRLIVKAKPQML